jgi:hypothetical protein
VGTGKTKQVGKRTHHIARDEEDVTADLSAVEDPAAEQAHTDESAWAGIRDEW